MNDMKMKLILDAVDKASPELQKVDSRMSNLNGSIATAGKGMAAFGTVVTGLALGKLAADFVDVNAKFDQLQASLETVTGSASEAHEQFKEIQEFASTTPYQLEEVTDAFIKMKALGLDSSSSALRSYGNTASAMGKSLNQMIEAVADAATGEFERLKEFGIKARQQGDSVALTFRGVTTQISKDAESIETYLRRIGDVEFAGGMDRQMKTLGGSLSNLSDSWDKFVRSVGDSGAVRTSAGAINFLSDSLDRLGTSLRMFKEMQTGGMTFMDWLTTDNGDLANRNVVEKAIAKAKVEMEKMEAELAMGGSNPTRARYLKQEIAYIKESISELEELMARRKELDQAETHNASEVPSEESSPQGKTSWTKQELDAFAESGQGVTGAWEQMFQDRYEIQSRSIQAEIDLEAQYAEDTKEIWDTAEDSWRSRDIGLSQYLTDLGDRLSALRESLMTEEELVEQSYQQRLATIKAAAAEEIITLQERNEMISQIEQEKATQLNEISQASAEQEKAVNMEKMNSILSNTTTALGNLGAAMDDGNKKQFQAHKAIAIVQTGISAVQAVMNALAVQPYPVGLALSISAGALGAANIARIRGMEYQGGKATGGWVLPGKSVIVGEEGPEVLTVGRDGGTVTPNHKLGLSGNSNSQSVSVTNVYQISPGVAGTVRAELLRMMPQIGAYSVQSVVAAINEGGDVARAVGRRG